MADRTRPTPPAKSVPKAPPQARGAAPRSLVSLEATHSERNPEVKTPIGKPLGKTDCPVQPQQKPVLKLEYALQKIRTNVEHARVAHRAKLYVEYADCCLVAFRLKQNSSEWDEFCNYPFWMNRGRVKPIFKIQDALYLVLIHAVYGLSRSGQKTSSKIAIALKEFTDTHHEKQDIVDTIQSVGLKELRRRNASPKKKMQSETSEDGLQLAQKSVVGLMGKPLVGVLAEELNTKFRIDAVLSQRANGKKFLKCLSLNKIQ